MSSVRPERSNPLHNFSLPPYLQWGNRKALRCIKFPSPASSPTSSPSSSRSDHHLSSKLLRHRSQTTPLLAATTTSTKRPFPYSSPEKSPKFDEENSNQIGFYSSPEKLATGLLKTENRTNNSMEEEQGLDESGCRPWNLRTRRSACKAPPVGESTGVKQDRCYSMPPRKKENSESPNGKMTATTSRTLRNSALMQFGEKRDRPKFSIQLSKEDIELDFLMLAGSRPPRRPKKRPRMLQKQLDFVCPGGWLTEITADRYKIPDHLQSGKS